MKVLVRKMSSLGLLKFRMISGTILMTAAMISIPVLIACMDVTLFLNPYVLGFVIAEMLFFGLVVYFFCIRPYFTYRALPEVLVETDGEFLYIHSKKRGENTDFRDRGGCRFCRASVYISKGVFSGIYYPRFFRGVRNLGFGVFKARKI